MINIAVWSALTYMLRLISKEITNVECYPMFTMLNNNDAIELI